MQHVRRTARLVTIATAVLLSVVASASGLTLADEVPVGHVHGAVEDAAAVELVQLALP